MKWAVGPRRIGKTTVAFRLLNQMAKANPGETLYYVSPTRRIAQYAFDSYLRLLDDIKCSYGASRSDMQCMVSFMDKGSCTVKFISAEDRHDRGFKSCKKVIDNADMILESMFGQIDLATGTGPNYTFKELPEKVKNLAKGYSANEDDIENTWRENGEEST